MTRNSEALESFTEYCKNNPDQRFWQALRNWSKYDRIIGFTIVGHKLYNPEKGMFQELAVYDQENTWHFEGLGGSQESVDNKEG